MQHKECEVVSEYLLGMDNVFCVLANLLKEAGYLLHTYKLRILTIIDRFNSGRIVVSFNQQELKLEVVEELAPSLHVVFLIARKENGNGPTLCATDLKTDAMIVPRCVRICNFPRLQLQWKCNLATFYETDGCVKFLTQVWIRPGYDVKEFMADSLLDLRGGCFQIVFGEDNGVGSGVCSLTFFISCRLDEEHLLRKRQRQSLKFCLNALKGGSNFLLLSIIPHENVLTDKLQVVLFGDITVRLHPSSTVERTHATNKVILRSENLFAFINGGENNGCIASEFYLHIRQLSTRSADNKYAE